MKKRIFPQIVIIAVIMSLSLVAYGSPNRAVTLSANSEPAQLIAGNDFISYQINLEIDKACVENMDMDSLEITVEQPTGVLSTIELKNVKYVVSKTADELKALSDSGNGTTSVLAFSISAKAGEKIAVGTYTIPMSITYKYTETIEKTATYNESVYFRVNTKTITPIEPSTSSLIFRGFKINEQPKDRDLEAGDRFIVLATMQNRGDTYLEDVKVSLTNLSPDLFTPVGESSTKFMDIDLGDKISAAFELRIGDNVKAGKYILTCRADYRTPEGLLKFEETQMFVTVGGEPSRPDSDFSTPVIMIKNYTYGGSNIVGGETFNLNLNFLNTNKESDIDNLKITISDTSDTIVPKSGSNTIYIEKIPKEESANHTIVMRSSVDADPKSYQLNINYQFETVINERRIKVTDTEEISIPLKQKEVLTVDKLELPLNAAINKEIPIAATFVNKGRTDITNLTAYIKGDNIIDEQPYYVGTLSAGRGDSYDAILKYTQAGEYSGEILFLYDNQDGEETEYAYPFTITVLENTKDIINAAKPVFAPRTDLETKKSTVSDFMSGINPIMILMVVLVTIVAIAVLIIRKNTKGKR